MTKIKKQLEQANHSQYLTLDTFQATLVSSDTRTRIAEALTRKENQKKYQGKELNERWRRHV